MKHIHLFITILLFLTSFPQQASAQHKYRLVWKENFRGKNLNQNSWSKIPRGGSDWNRHMSDCNNCYDMRHGKLILRGLVNTCCPNDSSRYQTGGVYTKGKKHITYGKVEVKAKFGNAQGAWPAIWMLPETGKWPHAGEIDIMEHLNHDSIAYQTVHSYYTYVLKKGDTPPHFSTGNIKNQSYNIYAVEILPDSLIFSINGKRTFSYPKTDATNENQYPFGTPFYLLIDMQIEGSWVGKAQPREYPIDMQIDWVKMYELKP